MYSQFRILLDDLNASESHPANFGWFSLIAERMESIILPNIQVSFTNEMINRIRILKIINLINDYTLIRNGSVI